MAAPITHHSSDAFDFFDDLFTKLFFQPDDEIALQALQDGLSDDLVQKANTDPMPLTKADFRAATTGYRAVITGSLDKRELLIAKEMPGQGAAIVTRAKVTTTVKQTGARSTKDMVLTIVIEEVGSGRRVVTDWMEVVGSDV